MNKVDDMTKVRDLFWKYSISLDKDIYERVVLLSEEKGITINELVRQLLNGHTLYEALMYIIKTFYELGMHKLPTYARYILYTQLSMSLLLFLIRRDRQEWARMWKNG